MQKGNGRRPDLLSHNFRKIFYASSGGLRAHDFGWISMLEADMRRASTGK